MSFLIWFVNNVIFVGYRYALLFVGYALCRKVTPPARNNVTVVLLKQELWQSGY